jgi:uncharacterized protein YraI
MIGGAADTVNQIWMHDPQRTPWYASSRAATLPVFHKLLVYPGAGMSSGLGKRYARYALATHVLRSGPGTSYGIVGQTLKGESLAVLDGPTNGFYRIRQGTLEGCVPGDNVTVVADSTPTATTATVATRLNLRGGPGTAFDALLVMPVGRRISSRNCRHIIQSWSGSISDIPRASCTTSAAKWC